MKAVLFDFDGTIADTLPLIFHAFRKVFAKYTGQTYSDADIVGMFGPPEKGMIRARIQPIHWEAALHDFLQFYDDEHERLVKAYPDIVNILQLLKDKGLLLGVVTGKGRDSANISLRHLDLAPFFDVIITGDDVAEPKPDPEGLLKAAGRLGVQPAEAVYVGDSNSDIVAGKRAGMGTIGVNWLSTSQSEVFSEQPDVFFDTFQPFRKWLLSATR